MENAFWNGAAMFYGNGGNAFDPLAKALDVAGHELSHGVIQHTANLEYQGESGAINESFADIFGAMIDRDDWKMGEDVVNGSVFPSGALRDLSNPHNGGTSGNFYWQPNHVNEQYHGSQDNGGVHINSGIANYAFYRFVQEMAKTVSQEAAKQKAEKVYYKALRDYLTKSSQFKDLRVAVEKAATDIHGSGSSEVAAVNTAFDAVGISSTGGGGSYQDDLNINPGDHFLLTADQQYQNIYLFPLNTGQGVVLSSSGVRNKPSITDDGSGIVFVAGDKTIHALIWNGSTYEESVIQNEAIWRNVAVSKDGSRIAALDDTQDNSIWVFDFGRAEWKEFELYNPTYTQGVSTGDVLYADAIEFDHSGEFIMYDAFNRLNKSAGVDYEYWDVGFVQVWNNSNNFWSDGDVGKLFSGLPENTSIGNPTFSKNSPYIVAFDLVYSDGFQTTYEIYGSNIETNEVALIWQNSVLGYPNYAVQDNALVFEAEYQNGTGLLATINLQGDKINAVQGSEASLIDNHHWGIFFANGERELDVPTVDLDEEIMDFRVLPNPVASELNVQFVSTKSKQIDCTVVNANGSEWLHQTIDAKPGQNHIALEVGKLTSGIYLIRFTSEDGESAVVPFMKR